MGKLIGMIHLAKKQLGMDDVTYREFLGCIIGKTSLKGTSERQQWSVMEELKKRGFIPLKVHKGEALVDDPQASKIRWLWLTMADYGIVRDRSEKALDNYVRRITGDSLKFATVKQLQLVIESLKRWLDRCEYPEVKEACQAACQEILKRKDAPPVSGSEPPAGGGSCAEAKE